MALLVSATACGDTVVDEDDGAGGGATSTAAGSSTTTGPDDPPVPTALYVDDGRCAVEAPVGEAEASLTLRGEEGLEQHRMVVELVFADECTDAGGHHIVARAADGSMMWLGARGCSSFEPDLVDGRVHAGLARVFEDDHSESLAEAGCIAFPGEGAPIESDLGVLAIAVFPSMEAAEAFAASIDD